jgi:hypothetical protein
LVSVRRAQGKEPAAERPKPPAEAKAILAAKRKKPGRKPKPAARAAVAKRPSQVEYIDLGNATTAAVKAHVSRVDDSTTIVDLRREVRVLRIERNALRAALDAIHGSDS